MTAAVLRIDDRPQSPPIPSETAAIPAQAGPNDATLLVPAPVPELDIVIPAYNEARRLPATLLATAGFLATQEWRTRIIVVDNGSSDDTAGVVRRMSSQVGDVPIEVMGCSRPGKGAAVRRGLLRSTSRYVGFFDADLATPVETLTLAVEHLQTGAAAVIGSRHVEGSVFVKPQPIGRRLGGNAFRYLARTAVTGVRDTQCGFKFFQRETAVRALVRCQDRGFAFDVELLRWIQRTGGEIVELPVAWTDGSESSFNPLRDGFDSFRAVAAMRRLAT